MCLILLVLLLSVDASAQSVLRPRLGSRDAPALPATPSTTIIEPASTPAHEVSVALTGFEVLCSDDAGDCTGVTWSCATCTPTSGSATQGGNGLTWTFSATLSCSAGGGTANTMTVTGSDGTLTSQDVLVITCTTPDGGPPGVIITTNTGADFSTSTSPETLQGTATDDVGVVTLTCLNVTTSQSCSVSSAGPATSLTWTATDIVLQAGANTIRITATDQATTSDNATIVLTYTPPLAITTASLAQATEDVAYAGATLAATGGTPPYTWDNNGAGTTLNDGDADCTGMTISSAGVISGTPNPAAVPATCSFTARVTDDDSATDTQALTLTIVSASAEVRQDYFEFQANTNGTGSGRSMCSSTNTGTDCILRFDDCPDATYGDNGACRLSEDRTGTITMTVALAKQQIAGMQPGTALDREMGTKQNFTIGYDADTYADKQLGAKVIIAGNTFGDGFCDTSPTQAGCPGLRGSENLELTFANIDIGSGGTGTVTFVAEEFYSPAWNSNGINGGGTDVVSNCTGGQLGTRNMRKTYRIDTVGKAIWMAWKTDFRQANADPYFLQDADGFWDCDDNVVAVTATTGQNSETKSFASTLVSPKTMGAVDFDGGTKPSGKDTYVLRTNNYDFPLMHSRWIRRILHIEYGVPANSAKFNDWRDDCDQRDRTSTAGSFEPGSANDQSAVPGTADYKCANMLTNDPATAGEAGACKTKDTDLSQCSIADQDPDCAVVGAANCSSLWAAVSSWVCDEVRGCRRTLWRVPWWQVSPSDGAALAMKLFQVEYDSSTAACEGCGDAIFYQGPVFAIVNIDASASDGDPSDIDDTGCPLACPGDAGTNPRSLFKKPVR